MEGQTDTCSHFWNAGVKRDGQRERERERELKISFFTLPFDTCWFDYRSRFICFEKILSHVGNKFSTGASLLPLPRKERNLCGMECSSIFLFFFSSSSAFFAVASPSSSPSNFTFPHGVKFATFWQVFKWKVTQATLDHSSECLKVWTYWMVISKFRRKYFLSKLLQNVTCVVFALTCYLGLSMKCNGLSSWSRIFFTSLSVLNKLSF